jgi:hypothetical protein
MLLGAIQAVDCDDMAVGGQRLHKEHAHSAVVVASKRSNHSVSLQAGHIKGAEINVSTWKTRHALGLKWNVERHSQQKCI